MTAMQLARTLIFIALVALASACGDAGDVDDAGNADDAGDAAVEIVFHSDRGGSDDIYLMRGDGSDVRQLTDEPGRDYEADVSPDGETIVFMPPPPTPALLQRMWTAPYSS